MDVRKISRILVIFLLAFAGTAFARKIVVAQDGSGDFTTIQAAIDAFQSGKKFRTIYVKNGFTAKNCSRDGGNFTWFADNPPHKAEDFSFKKLFGPKW